MNKEQAYLSIINATIKTLNECIQRMNSHIRNYSQTHQVSSKESDEHMTYVENVVKVLTRIAKVISSRADTVYKAGKYD